VTGQPALLLPGHETWATSAIGAAAVPGQPAGAATAKARDLGAVVAGRCWRAAAAGINRSGDAGKKDARKDDDPEVF
jgi:hypothetical protein